MTPDQLFLYYSRYLILELFLPLMVSYIVIEIIYHHLSKAVYGKQ
jgi:hypothetical protein